MVDSSECVKMHGPTNPESNEDSSPIRPIRVMRTMWTSEGQLLVHLNLTTPFLIHATQTVSTKRISWLILYG